MILEDRHAGIPIIIPCSLFRLLGRATYVDIYLCYSLALHGYWSLSDPRKDMYDLVVPSYNLDTCII